MSIPPWNGLIGGFRAEWKILMAALFYRIFLQALRIRGFWRSFLSLSLFFSGIKDAPIFGDPALYQLSSGGFSCPSPRAIPPLSAFDVQYLIEWRMDVYIMWVRIYCNTRQCIFSLCFLLTRFCDFCFTLVYAPVFYQPHLYSCIMKGLPSINNIQFGLKINYRLPRMVRTVNYR